MARAGSAPDEPNASLAAWLITDKTGHATSAIVARLVSTERARRSAHPRRDQASDQPRNEPLGADDLD
jgi:hypothetical protein